MKYISTLFAWGKNSTSSRLEKLVNQLFSKLSTSAGWTPWYFAFSLLQSTLLLSDLVNNPGIWDSSESCGSFMPKQYVNRGSIVLNLQHNLFELWRTSERAICLDMPEQLR